jgi:5-methylcytosine-specific restriction enzyme A
MNRSAHAKQYRKLYQTKRWKALRRDHLNKNPYCVMCGKIANTVDHIHPHKGDLTKFHDPRNLQSLTKDCHDTHKQRLESRGYHGDVDESGWPSDVKHPANLGNQIDDRTKTSTG